MRDYIDSLLRLRTLNFDALLPGHGDRIDDPARAIDWIVEHRLEREAKVLQAVLQHPGLSSHDLVPHVYQDVAEHLFRLAERSLLAHLLKLERDRIAFRRGDTWLAGREEN
jgi:glyoxylase-like metal-dependent hydrolase (beta-lactamase superfamily II)